MAPQELQESLAVRAAGANEDVQYIDVREVGGQAARVLVRADAGARAPAGLQDGTPASSPCPSRRLARLHPYSIHPATYLQEGEARLAKLPHFVLFPLSRWVGWALPSLVSRSVLVH